MSKFNGGYVTGGDTLSFNLRRPSAYENADPNKWLIRRGAVLLYEAGAPEGNGKDKMKNSGGFHFSTRTGDL